MWSLRQKFLLTHKVWSVKPENILLGDVAMWQPNVKTLTIKDISGLAMWMLTNDCQLKGSFIGASILSDVKDNPIKKSVDPRQQNI